MNDGLSISSFHKWEQAFRIYSNIYTKFHPQWSSELIEYNHIIHTIAQNYTWENVYMYDKDFRIHMGHYPNRNWNIILQQAWSLRLKDKINSGNVQSAQWVAQNSGRNGDHMWDDNGRINEPCRRYNKGRCPFGSDCHYEHHCSYCFKFGHSVLFCRKLQADQERGRARSFDKKSREHKHNNGHQASDNNHPSCN